MINTAKVRDVADTPDIPVAAGARNPLIKIAGKETGRRSGVVPRIQGRGTRVVRAGLVRPRPRPDDRRSAGDRSGCGALDR